MSEKPDNVWTLTWDLAGGGTVTVLGVDGGAAQVADDELDFLAAEEGQAWAPFALPWPAAEKGKAGHDLSLLTGRCPCCPNQVVDRWLTDDPAGGAHAPDCSAQRRRA